MTLPDAAERTECATVAASIIATLRASSWDVLAWQALRLASPRLAGVSVTLAATQGRYDDVGTVSASSSITISVPRQGAVTRFVTQAQLDDLKRVVRGALVHECTHVIQRAAVPETYAAAVALEAQLHAMASPTHDEAFDLYIGQPLEQQARAAQAAAEVEADRTGGAEDRLRAAPARHRGLEEDRGAHRGPGGRHGQVRLLVEHLDGDVVRRLPLARSEESGIGHARRRCPALSLLAVAPPPAGAPRDRAHLICVKSNFGIVDALRAVAEEVGRRMAQIALA